jgi:carbamate kinase
VGFILRRSEIAAKVEGLHEVPLDVCVADSQGAIGYALQQTLQNWLFQRGIHKNVATVVTQVLVRTPDLRGRRAVCEVMVMNRAIGKLIMTDQTHMIPSALQTGKDAGMQTMDQSLLAAIQAREVDP